MLCSEASAQSASRIGEYSYDRGVYRRVTDEVINQTINAAASVSGTVNEAQNFLNNTATFGGWRASNNAVGGAAAGLGFQLQSPFARQANHLSNNDTVVKSPWVGLRLGPLFVDNVYAGAGAMYSEFDGVPLYGANQSPRARDDDNWATIVWAQVRATAYVTDRLALSFTPGIYYLPLENEVGWALGFPLLTIGGFSQPNALVHLAFRQPIGESLQFVMMEQFNVMHPQVHLMRNNPYYWTNLGDATPIDMAGRYQFGGFGPYNIDQRGSSEFALNDRFMDENQLLLMNQASMSLMGRHGANISSQLFYNRWDYWDHNFDFHQTWQSGGLQIVQDAPAFRPYARYEFTASDHWQTNYHYAVIGAQKNFNTDLVAYAEAGWLWSNIENAGSTDSWIALAGVRQRLGPYTWHGIDFGRTPMANFRSRYLSTYGQYYLVQTIASNSNLTFFAQQAELDELGNGGELARSVFTAGAILNVILSPKSEIQFTTAYEDGSIESVKREWQMWTYRLSYIRTLSSSVHASVFYQYQDAFSMNSAYDDFSEHLLYLGVAKRF